MNLLRRTACTLALACAITGTAGAQDTGKWFDIGISQEVTVPSDDGLAWEYFPPYPFGETYPPGTLVYARMYPVACEVIPQLYLECETRRFVNAYVGFFNDGGCGCGGYLFKPVTLRIPYDEAVVAGHGVPETQLGVIHYNWDALAWETVPAVRVLPEANAVEFEFAGWILAEHYYVVVAGTPTPVEPATWGRIKALW